MSNPRSGVRVSVKRPAAKKSSTARAPVPAAPVRPKAATNRPVARPTRKSAAKRAVANGTRAAAIPATIEATPGVEAAEAPKLPKPEKQRVKLVRDSFTMPADEFAAIDVLKARALEAKRPAKKSELLRVGLQLLSQLETATLVERLDALPALKAGRPKKHR